MVLLNNTEFRSKIRIYVYKVTHTVIFLKIPGRQFYFGRQVSEIT